jgi:serine/threonine protein phosphatase PrpC
MSGRASNQTKAGSGASSPAPSPAASAAATSASSDAAEVDEPIAADGPTIDVKEEDDESSGLGEGDPDATIIDKHAPVHDAPNGAAPKEPAAAEATPPEDEKAKEPAGPISIRLFGRTDVGQIREHNEDNFLVADLTKGSRGLMEVDRAQKVGQRGTVLGVCDGMGGAAAGEVASQLAVDIVYEKMLAGSPPASRDDLAARLVTAIESAGERIFSDAKADRSRRGMGTTATIAALVDNHLFLGQVGDSRGYLLRGDRLVQVTRDQSLVNQLIEAGQLTEEEAESFEHNNIILQALGTAESVQVDLTYVELRKGDALLLCSDGLSGMVRNDEIREVLRTIDEPLEACRELTDRANQAGGHDNVTVVIARFEGEGLSDPTADDIASLKYRKYELPEGAASTSDGSGALSPRAMTLKSIRPPSRRGDDEDEDDVEGGSPARLRDEPVDLPRHAPPSWLATMLIVSAVTCVVVLGYYFLR